MMSLLTIALGIVCGIIGLAVLALCIQNGKKIAAWRTARRAKKAAARLAALATATGGAPITTAKKRDWKKQFETGIAFAKLAALVALIGVFFVFLVGPKYFWGDYYAPPSQTPAVQVQMSTAQQTTSAIPPASRTIVIPIGDLNAPLDKWSEEVRVVPGWEFRTDVMGQSGRRYGVLVDGSTKIVNEPGKRLNTHATQSLRFIVLDGQPMTMSVVYYR